MSDEPRVQRAPNILPRTIAAQRSLDQDKTPERLDESQRQETSMRWVATGRVERTSRTSSRIANRVVRSGAGSIKPSFADVPEKPRTTSLGSPRRGQRGRVKMKPPEPQFHSEKRVL
jgi:hypothetical protein